jgi:hypothetical protein
MVARCLSGVPGFSDSPQTSYLLFSMLRRRTHLDRKFSQGDANSQAYVDNWDSVFLSDSSPPESADPPEACPGQQESDSAGCDGGQPTSCSKGLQPTSL